MINLDSVRETIATYVKHGWILRRVLLSDRSEPELTGREKELFGEAPVKTSVLDAAWFSRPPRPGEIAWELRYLGDIPFALLEYVDEHSPDLEAALADVETRMAETIAKKQQA